METLYFPGISAKLIQPALLPSAKRLRAVAAELLARSDRDSFHERVERAGKLLAAANEVEAAAGDLVSAQADRLVADMRAAATA